jgi:hypothetical protein
LVKQRAVQTAGRWQFVIKQIKQIKEKSRNNNKNE